MTPVVLLGCTAGTSRTRSYRDRWLPPPRKFIHQTFRGCTQCISRRIPLRVYMAIEPKFLQRLPIGQINMWESITYYIGEIWEIRTSKKRWSGEKWYSRKIATIKLIRRSVALQRMLLLLRARHIQGWSRQNLISHRWNLLADNLGALKLSCRKFRVNLLALEMINHTENRWYMQIQRKGQLPWCIKFWYKVSGWKLELFGTVTGNPPDDSPLYSEEICCCVPWTSSCAVTFWRINKFLLRCPRKYGTN